MDWSTIIILIVSLVLLSRFPISSASSVSPASVKPISSTSVKPDDTINECLSSGSNGQPNPDDKSSVAAETAIRIPGETPPSPLGTSSARLMEDAENKCPVRDLPQPSASTSASSPFSSSSATQNSQANLATNFEIQTANPSPQLGNRPDHSHLHPDVMNTQEVQRDKAFKLGKSFLVLCPQALLALILFHFESLSRSQSPLSPSSSTSAPPIPVGIVGAAMAIGFGFTLIGIMMRNAYPKAASIIEYIGIFSGTFGFSVIAEMFLPKSFSWIVWPTGVVLFLIFAIVIAKMG